MKVEVLVEALKVKYVSLRPHFDFNDAAASLFESSSSLLTEHI